MECLFCKIAAGTIKSNIIYQDEHILAFDDIQPQAPLHKLIIPRQHIATLNDLDPDSQSLVGQMVLIGKKLAQELGIAQDGYRLVFNCNQQGGQEVYHLHLHLLGGRQMNWPPG
jgi:histidine triad (HIT) family protein